MALKATSPATNGRGRRKLTSWIDEFVTYTNNLESPEIWRKWAAISTIAAILEQKVHVTTSSPLYPNLYTFLVGDAGTGKTKAIMAAHGFVDELPELHLGATSMTMASLVDHMNEAKRTIIRMPEAAIEYNTLLIMADELSAFMDQFDTGLIAGLTTFFDCVPYSQGRRVKDIRIKIRNPQLNILSGTTPSNLLKFIPEFAWEQGFTSRVLLIYSDERPIIDVFNTPFRPKPKDMIHDLKVINSLHGEFGWTEDFAKAMHNWKLLGFDPVPNHPKLEHYRSRRFSHLLKLAMVASIDRGDALMLEKADFNRAMGWLLEAEALMPNIFKSGSGSADSKAIDEIVHFVRQHGDGVSEHKIINFARLHVEYANNVVNLLNLMEKSGMLVATHHDPKTMLRMFKAPVQH